MSLLLYIVVCIQLNKLGCKSQGNSKGYCILLGGSRGELYKKGKSATSQFFIRNKLFPLYYENEIDKMLKCLEQNNRAL